MSLYDIKDFKLFIVHSPYEEMLASSRAFRTVFAKSALTMGLYASALIPISAALSSVIFLLYPVHKTTGISGLIFISSPASLSPVMFGIVISVTTISNAWGLDLNNSRASTLLVLVVTVYPSCSRTLLPILAMGASSSTNRIDRKSVV